VAEWAAPFSLSVAVGATPIASQEQEETMTQPYAADDFAIIRARLEELRREQAGCRPKTEHCSEKSPRPYRGVKSGEAELEGHRVPRSVSEKLLG